MAWIVVDPGLASAADWGAETTLPPGSVVFGAKAIRSKTGVGSSGGSFCELMVIGEVPDRLKALRQNYLSLASPLDGEAPGADDWTSFGAPAPGVAAPEVPPNMAVGSLVVQLMLFTW